MDLNKVMIIGRLTRDPELRTIPSGASVCQVGIATSYVYTNQQTGQKVEQVEYHNVVLWRKLGEIAAQYLKKGAQVFIEGRLQTRSWDDKNGGSKHYRTEIVGDNMIMLGKPSGQNSSSPASSGSSAGYNSAPRVASPAQADSTTQSAPIEELPTIQQGEDINVDDIPF